MDSIRAAGDSLEASKDVGRDGVVGQGARVSGEAGFEGGQAVCEVEVEVEVGVVVS